MISKSQDFFERFLGFLRDFWGLLRDLGIFLRILKGFLEIFKGFLVEFLDIQNCSQIFGIFIRFLDFSIRFLFEISAKVYEIFSSDTPLDQKLNSVISKCRFLTCGDLLVILISFIKLSVLVVGNRALLSLTRSWI